MRVALGACFLSPRRLRRRVLLDRNPLALVLFAALAACGGGCTKPAEQAPPKITYVRVAQVVRGEVAPEVELVGTVIPMEVSRVASGAAGQVLEFPFREGAMVTQGNRLAKLRDVTVNINLEAAKALLAEKEQYYQQLLAGYRDEEKQQAKARELAAAASLEYAEARLRRVQQLFARSAINKNDLDEAQSEAKQARQTLAEAQAQSALTQAGYRAEEIEQAKAARDGQRQAVLRLQDELAKHEIVAPFTGYLVQKHTDVGEWVTLGGQVATLVNLESVDVVVHVDESQVGMLRLGAPVHVRFDSQGEKFTGAIQFIVPRSNWQEGSRSFPVHVRVKNRIVNGLPALKEGMLGHVSLHGESHQATLVPKDAVVRSSGKPVVFIVGDDGKARPVDIVEGLTRDGFIEVSRGDLRPGQSLVTDGAERLRPFQAVTPHPADSPSPVQSAEAG